LYNIPFCGLIEPRCGEDLLQFEKITVFFCCPFFLGTCSGQFLRQAAPGLLLSPFVPTNVLEARGSLVVLLAKVSAFLT